MTGDSKLQSLLNSVDSHVELGWVSAKDANLAKDSIRYVWNVALEEAAIACENKPVNEARCAELQLTTQAWEESADDCVKTIRSLKV